MTEGGAERLAGIPMGERVLLLPHCLRPSQACPGRPSRDGLACPTGCTVECSIRALREEALCLGYKAVCVAPGGALALRFVQDAAPRAVVAIACAKELREGEDAARAFSGARPEVVVLALSRDGCVDTEVNLEDALRLLRS